MTLFPVLIIGTTLLLTIFICIILAVFQIGKIMATIEEVTQSVNDLTAALGASNATLDLIDAKLDEIATFIQGLVPAATQEQLNALAALVTSAKEAAQGGQTKAEAVLTETDALDG